MLFLLFWSLVNIYKNSASCILYIIIHKIIVLRELRFQIHWCSQEICPDSRDKVGRCDMLGIRYKITQNWENTKSSSYYFQTHTSIANAFTTRKTAASTLCFNSDNNRRRVWLARYISEYSQLSVYQGHISVRISRQTPHSTPECTGGSWIIGTVVLFVSSCYRWSWYFESL